jgi:hypothetical protein
VKVLFRYTATAIAAVGIALAGTVSAFAAFEVSASEAVMRFKSATMPALDSAPAVEQRAAKVKIAWVAQKIGGTHVERYLVTRYNMATGAATQVCGNQVSTARCTDADVPLGRWKYTVRTVQRTWTGPESKRSDVVKIDATDVASAASSVADQAPGDAATMPETATTPSTASSPSSNSPASDSNPAAVPESSKPTNDPEPVAEPQETTVAPKPPEVAEPSSAESSSSIAAPDDEVVDN